MARGRMALQRLTRDIAAVEPWPTWAETTAAFVSDPVELALVDELRTALGRDGGFREPVVVDLEEREICDGRHRVVAALLAGARDIAYVSTYDDVAAHEELVELTVRLTPERGASPVEDAFAWLRSFPLGDDAWVTADVGSGAADWWQTLYHCRHADVPRLRATVLRLAHRQGLSCEITHCRAVTPTDLGAEDAARTQARSTRLGGVRVRR